MHRYTVRYTVGSDSDIDAVYDYIFYNLKNPISAEKIVVKIRQACEALAIFPKGHSIKLKNRGIEYRFTYVKKYVIIYHIDEIERAVYIDYIMYARRNIAKAIA